MALCKVFLENVPVDTRSVIGSAISNVPENFSTSLRLSKKSFVNAIIMSYPTLYDTVRKSRFLYSLLKPVANWYTNAAGYRQLGMCSERIMNIILILFQQLTM